MPEGAIADPLLDSYSLLRRLERSGHRSEVVLDLHGSFRPDQSVPFGRHSLIAATFEGTLGRFHVFLSDLESHEAAIQAAKGRRFASSEGLAFLFEELPKDLGREFYTSKSLLGALPRPERSWPFPPDVVASFGLYVFEHLCGSWAAGPYGRLAFPRQPLTLGSLPPEIRGSSSLVHFTGISFESRLYLQPCEELLCQAYFDMFLSTDFDTERRINEGLGPDKRG